MMMKSTVRSPQSAVKLLKKLVILIVLSVNCSHAAFLDIGYGVRATSLGGAYTALSRGPEGLLYNPAGSAASDCIEAAFTYIRPYLGIDLVAGDDKTELGMNHGSFIYPFKVYGSLGLAVSNFTTTDIYSESAYYLNYSISVDAIKKFADKFKSKDSVSFGGFGFNKKVRKPGAYKPVIYLGMNLKLLNHSYILDRYAESDPVFASSDSKSAISLDMGVLVKYTEKLSFGLALKDLNQPDVGITDNDPVPMESRIGAVYRLKKALFLLDLSYRNSFFGVHAGTELSLKPLMLRVGGNLEQITAGFGVGIKMIDLNYSLNWPLYLKDSSGSHCVSLVFRLGRRKPEEMQIEEEAVKKRKPEIKTRKKKIKKVKKPVKKKTKKQKITNKSEKIEKEKPEEIKKEMQPVKQEEPKTRRRRKRIYSR